MKRYLIFAGSNYYPSGGWEDFIDSCDTRGGVSAYIILACKSYDWWHVVDTKTGEICDHSVDTE